MVAGANLLTQIPIPKHIPHYSNESAPVASIRVGDVSGDKPENKGFIEKIKDSFIQKRIKTIENKPPEKRSETEKAELEANKQALDYMV